METEYPWDGHIKITVTESSDTPWKLSLRVPEWCQKFSLRVNGQEIQALIQKGYLVIERSSKEGDVIDVEFAMPPFFVEPDPRIDSVRDCVGIQRGPVVYCLEEQDQQQGVNLLDVKIDPSEELTSHWQGDLLNGVMTLEGTGFQLSRSEWQTNGLYHFLQKETRSPERKLKLTAIPYYAWGNRGLKSMRVWIPRWRR
jgi:DUF1680 family protein